MLKVVSLFLVAMVVLALFGRLRLPASMRLIKCPDCGCHRRASKPCPCGGTGRRG
ncbi:MAG: hypothetical protein Q8Q63_00080 [Phaeovulum sp.]|uniref:hypothetical protein n=1 Tax=Phaeovulum sp. TaxID=2934796 RepID=UPI00272F4086|nr:hypothetical protein [Phaeovulum sp.]MDP2063497.1 hypothetical protein [Phaeovulum sp.]MDP3859964.1 hypothetical protein [Phaeovulum sp.]